jgi:hypothetical protein
MFSKTELGFSKPGQAFENRAVLSLLKTEAVFENRARLLEARVGLFKTRPRPFETEPRPC